MLQLLSRRKNKDDKNDGYLGGSMYAHALGTIALCEAYGLSADERPADERPKTKTGFRPPSAAQRKSALGTLQGVPKRLAKSFDPGDQFEPIPAPQPGELAPEFELRSPDNLTTVRLSSFRRQKPVVLIFGSFT